MADIGLIGWQRIMDRLTASADGRRVNIIALFRQMLEMNGKHYDAAEEMSLVSYLVFGCLIVFIQGDAVKIGSFTEDMFLPF